MVSADLKAFVSDHQPHGQLTGDADEPTSTGHRLWITVPVRGDGRAVDLAGRRRRGSCPAWAG
jgi:hypothetical protein